SLSKDAIHPQVSDKITAFMKKAELWRRRLLDGVTDMFPQLTEVVRSRLVIRRLLVRFPRSNCFEQDTEPLIAPDVQCAISANVKFVYIVSRTYVSRFGYKRLLSDEIYTRQSAV